MNLGNLKLIIITIFIYSLFSYSLQSEPIEGNLVEIHILDKISAKVTNLKIQVNSSLNFESLNIKIYACYTTPPDEIPEDFVLLKIYDKMEKNNNQLIYQGWMISSSPAATPLEHPIYDLWLQDCK
tara:strand:+ start:67 stop:444 length:378 start_codon:yes stop_codon:yes gene_type:complete